MSENIDNKIMEAISKGKYHFFEIRSFVGGDSWRAIDRRIQSLRRRGVIEYTGQSRDAGWRIVESKP